MKIIQNGYKLTSDFKTFPTQFSENVEVQFIRDKKFSEAFIQPFIAYGKGRIHVLAPTILEDDTIVFPKEVFVDSGEIALSVSVEANNKIENTEVLAIRVLKSAGLENVLPENKDTWQTVLKNYLMQELKLNINPRIETIVNETERLQNNTALLQDEIAKLIKESNDKVNKLISDVTKMVNDGEFDGSTIMNGEGVPSNSIGKENDLYINKLSEGDFAQFLFIKTNGVWIPQFKVAGRDGTDSLPIKGSMFLPEGLAIPPGYATFSEHYVPAEYIGIDGSTSLPDALNATNQRIKNIEDNGTSGGDSIPIDASIIYKGERSKIPPNFELHALPFSNPNLVINPDFKIWQEGEEMTVTNGQYVADVWRVYITDASSVTIKKVPNGLQVVSLNNPGLNPSVNIYQLIEATSFLENAKCIVQQCINDVIETYSRTLNSDSLKRISLVSVNSLRAGDIVNWVKVELGEMATPFVPRSYTEELTLCQRYYQVYDWILLIRATYYNNNSVFTGFPLYQHMRKSPTASAVLSKGGNTISSPYEVVVNQKTVTMISIQNIDISTVDLSKLYLDARFY